MDASTGSIGEQTTPNFLTELLTLENQQQNQIAKVVSTAELELFSQVLDLDDGNTSGQTQLEVSILSRIKLLEDQLNSTQIKTIESLCLEKLSSLDAKDAPKLNEVVMDFLNTTATIDNDNVIEMIRYAHENQSMPLLQKCFRFIETATNTSFSSTDFGHISIKIGKQNNDEDFKQLNSYIPHLTAAFCQNNIQIELTTGNFVSMETLTSFVNENSKSIYALNIKAKQVNDEQIIELLKNCANLNQLVVKSTKITEEGLQVINHLTNLQTLNLSGCTAFTSLNLAALTKLQTLNLSGCKALTSLNLAGFTSLETLDLSNCRALTSLILVGLTNLRSLLLEECTALATLELAELTCLQSVALNSCKSLISLRLTGLIRLGWLFIGACTALTSLELTRLTSLQTFALTSSAALTTLSLVGLTSLRWLQLGGCKALISANLVELTKLITLDFSNCRALNSLKLMALTSLQVLDLSFCNSLTTVSDLDQLRVGMKCLREFYLPDLDKLAPNIGFIFSFLKFHTMVKAKNFFDNDFTQVQKDRLIQHWMSGFSLESGASSSSSPSQSPPDNLNKLFETYNALKSSNPTNPPPTLHWMQFALLRLVNLDESARQWVLDKGILDVVLKFQNPTARYPIAEVIFRVAEDLALRVNLDAKEKKITSLISGRHDLKALFPYLIVALEGRRVNVKPLKVLLEWVPGNLLKDRIKYGIIFTLFTSLYFLDELDRTEIDTLIKAFYTQSHFQGKFDGRVFLKRCSDISTLIGFEAFDKLKQENLEIIKAVEEAFTEAVPVNVEDLVTKFNNTYAAWRNPFAIMAFASKIKSLDDPYLSAHLYNLVTATVEGEFSEFRYDLERVPDLKAIDQIDSEFLSKWKNTIEYPTQEWSPSDLTQTPVLNNKREKNGKYVIYVTDHPSDLLNIGEISDSCQNVFYSGVSTNQGVLGSSLTGTFQLIVMKSAYGPGEKCVSRILIHAHPHGDQIAVYAEELYDDTKLQGVKRALMDYARDYVESRGSKCVFVYGGDLGGTPYGSLESNHLGPPVYLDSLRGLQHGDYKIPKSYRYS